MTEAWDAPVEDAADGGGFATFDMLAKKPRRTATFTIHLPDDDGSPQARRMRFRAIPPKRYDRLVAEHPPSKADREKGSSWNPETFPAALVAAVSDVPRLSLEQAQEIADSEEWSGGEFATLFLEALKVCNQGLDVPFSAGG